MLRRAALVFTLLASTTIRADEPRRAFIAALLARMTVDEKIGQLNLLGASDAVTGAARDQDLVARVAQGQVGGIFNLRTAARVHEMQRVAVERSRLGVPLLFGLDVVHGYETVFPIPLGLSCTWDLALIERSARIAAEEATLDGIAWTFSPIADLGRDARWGRMAETSGEDPYLASQIVAAMVRGYQGPDLSRPDALLACVKHFALYGAAEAGRDYNTVDMSRSRMYNEYFPPYKAAIDAGAGSVMTAFNEVDGVPATGNAWLLRDVLRKAWRFSGLVVTDYEAINNMVDHGLGDLPTVSAEALRAGVQMDMVGEGFLTTLKASLAAGRAKLADLDEAVRAVLGAKYDLGLFGDPYRRGDAALAARELFSDARRAEARRTAARSLVLLKNDGHVLPLGKRSTIALIGVLADAKENMAGTWSVAAKQDRSTSLLAGLRAAVGAQGTILYAKGSNLVDDAVLEANATPYGKTLHRDPRSATVLRDEAVRIAKRADVVVAALGEAAEMSGESASRTRLEIPEVQKDLLRALLRTKKPVVLVLFNGRPLVLTEEAKTVPAILEAWFPGSEAGHAIADVLFGDENPSGKLTTSFPRAGGQVPIYYGHKNTGRPVLNPDGPFEKYRSNYLDERNDPLFPFGYGLSYTTFSYGTPSLSHARLNEAERVTISVDVTNTGRVAGSETVQLYVHDVYASVTRPVRELRGWQRVTLGPGATKTVRFTLGRDDLAFYGRDLTRITEPGTFEVFVGGDARAPLGGRFELVAASPPR